MYRQNWPAWDFGKQKKCCGFQSFSSWPVCMTLFRLLLSYVDKHGTKDWNLSHILKTWVRSVACNGPNSYTTTHNMGQVTQTSMFVAGGKGPSNQPQTSKLSHPASCAQSRVRCLQPSQEQYKHSTVRCSFLHASCAKLRQRQYIRPAGYKKAPVWCQLRYGASAGLG